MPVLLVLFAVAALALSGTTAVEVMQAMTERERIKAAMRGAAERYGIDPNIPDALAAVESGYDMGATNQSGPDGARGGAWGPTQLTERTARAYGYAGPMDALTTDPELAAEWTARILAARPGGPPPDIGAAAAWWNAGKRDLSLAPDSTRTVYYPRALAAYNAAAEEAGQVTA